MKPIQVQIHRQLLKRPIFSQEIGSTGLAPTQIIQDTLLEIIIDPHLDQLAKALLGKHLEYLFRPQSFHSLYIQIYGGTRNLERRDPMLGSKTDIRFVHLYSHRILMRQ